MPGILSFLNYSTLPLNIQFGIFCLIVFLGSGLFCVLAWLADKIIERRRRRSKDDSTK